MKYSIHGFILLIGLMWPAMPARAADVPEAWLLHLPGIAGEAWVDRDMVDGLRDGGYAGPIETYDWTCKDPGITALLARKRNDGEAQKIADKITARFRADPKVRIILTGHSGGCGLAVWALEKLPADVKVDTLLFLAPALSPDYDLSVALSHVRGKAYAFTSPNDAIVLGAGTRVFGTIDGKHVDAAGRFGFRRPAGADAAQYEKLVARPYEAAWTKYDHIGDHIGVMSRPFSAHLLAPLVLAELPAGATTRPAAQPAGQRDEVPEYRRAVRMKLPVEAPWAGPRPRAGDRDRGFDLVNRPFVRAFVRSLYPPEAIQILTDSRALLA